MHLARRSNSIRNAVCSVLSYPSCVCVWCPHVIWNWMAWDCVFVFQHTGYWTRFAISKSLSCQFYVLHISVKHTVWKT